VGCLKISSFLWQNFVSLSAGVPLERERQKGVHLEDVILPLLARIVWKRLQIDTNMLLIIISTGDRLFRFINIDDLKRPWTSKRGSLVNILAIFWMQRTFQRWIATKWLEIEQDNLRMKFSALNVDFKSPSPDLLNSRSVPYVGYGGLKFKHFFKMR